MLTTIDNEWNPFTNYDEWLARDHELGYDTNNYLARIAMTSDEFSDAENERIIDEAMIEIVLENDGLYQIVTNK